MKDQTGQSYRKRLTDVVDYIHRHLDCDLDVNRLAEVALMSPYHFHRIYRQLAGEPVNATVRRLRLHFAAMELIRSNRPLQSIAQQAAYSSLEAFSRAFSKQLGESPSHYRAANRQVVLEPFVAMLTNPVKRDKRMYDVEIINVEELPLIGYEHCGDYMGIGQAFEKLAINAGSRGLINEHTRWFGLYFGDPKTVSPEELKSAACITVDADTDYGEHSAPQPMTIPAGRCATLVHKGPYAELEQPYDWLFGQWLPNSGYEAANFPVFEEYLNDPKTTPPNELLTRIYCLLA